MESRKYDVFVSYSRKDAEIVDRICQLMRQKQITYYRDILQYIPQKKLTSLLVKIRI